ncbi:CPBP family intramembrane glutamic endopeptidase [Ethanoligenens harbinense]|uniref:Abortive infection protein n=1 Tax=Ethanoligenens harbinense (strain DSM 18485 / JCM 12961 / CGMCC 1.5033 / YUAN-3) TaxID=663278 RepID=E6U871_ETHHY|nr:CPBP family intramembrane glutamic endopeptidase [Ethanoligenens harbinense]ADU27090.1 Abortive infection protein [Ethanoligenens harbinense YUAN-3]
MRKSSRWSLIEELDLPSPQAEHALQDTRRLRGMSSIIGFSLATQQLVAAAVVFILVAIGGVIQTLWQGGFTLADLQNHFRAFQQYDTAPSLLQNMVCYFAYMFVPFILLTFCLKKNPFAIVPVGPIHEKRRLPVALVISLALAFVSALVSIYIDLFLGFLHLRISAPDMTPPTQPGLIVLYILFFCALAPVCEEFIFRGVILQSLRPYGNGFAILLSSLLFAMMHGNLAQFPLAFLVGLAFGYFVVRFESIWATVLMHACVNLVSTLVNYVEIQAGTAVANLLYLGLGVTLLAIAVSTVLVLRSRQSVRERFARAMHTRLPLSFLFKKVFLTPGMLVFTVLFILLCIAGLRLT